MESKGSTGIVHMTGGTGPGSYYDFSKTLLASVNEFFWPKLSDAIAIACSKQHLLLADDDGDAAARAAIADFGCSCALSTINTMHFMARSLASSSLAAPTPAKELHIQAFFSDLPSNDFNTLFALISSSSKSATDAGLQTFMPCGVPGSFYSRLFPPRSLHIGLCALALHNLSQVPDAVRDANSPAWNENGVWVLEGCKPETTTAYKKQFERDFTCFLQHRSQELVQGGLLFCVIIASQVDATSASQTMMDHNHLHSNLQTAWRQLVSEGLLEQKSLDTFNLPIYMPTIDEVKKVVDGDMLQAQFKVLQVEYEEVERVPRHVWMERAATDAQTWGNTCEMMERNFIGGLIQPHLGLAKFELLMERLRNVAAADDEVHRTNMMHVIVLALARQ